LGKSLSQASTTGSRNSFDISVVIVTYNRLDHLRNCLQALRNQTLAKDRYEVIVVDDGSTDGTREFLCSLEWPEGPRYRYFLEEHRGLVAARNFGVSKSNGRIVSFTDDDCIPEPRWLEKVLETFAEDDRIGVVGAVTKPVFRNRLFRPMNAFLRKDREKKVSLVSGEVGLVGLRPFSGCNLHIDRDVFVQLSGFNEKIQPSEDIDFMYRYLRAGGLAANRLDMYVEHYERDDLKSMFRRWFSFGRNDPSMLRRYLAGYLCYELDAFHGRLRYSFGKIRFPLTVYFQANTFKILLLSVFPLLLDPWPGGLPLAVVVGGLALSQRNLKATLSFLGYTIYSQLSYFLGALSTATRHRVIFL